MRGAEAVLRRATLLGRAVVVKERIAKGYREALLDRRLRKERTRSEAKLLHKAKVAGVPCPVVFEAGEFSITMGFLEGGRPDMGAADAQEAGKLLATLHAADIIHGDYTPANLIRSDKLYVIDFGLGFVSNDIEDKAVDVFTLLRSIRQKNAFLNGYRTYPKAASVLERVKGVEKRVRYAL
jgi:Kae1-associated kinase Bud32